MAYDNIQIRVNAITKTALNKVTVEGARIFKEEIPRRSGELEGSVEVELAKDMPDGTIRSKIIIDSEYARAVDEGIPAEANKFIEANNKYLAFSDWPAGPERLRWRDGLFHFTKVRHVVPANKFSKRATKRIKAIGRTSLFKELGGNLKKFFREFAK